MSKLVCPKCGFEQDEGNDCLQCGIIFARYQAAPQSSPDSPPLSETSSPAGAFKRFYRVFRWLMLAGTVVVVMLVLRQTPPPQIEADPDAGRRVESKVSELQKSIQIGESHILRLKEAELNSWLADNLVLAPGASATGEAGGEQAQPGVQDLKIDLVGDRMRLYVVFDFHGQDLSLLLEGQVQFLDNYIRLKPTSGKLGSLPIPQMALDQAVQKIFESPENREKFKLPDEVADIRVENSEFVISFK